MVSLADDGQLEILLVPHLVELGPVQGCELCDPQAGGEEHLKDCSVPETHKVISIRCFQESFYLVEIQEFHSLFLIRFFRECDPYGVDGGDIPQREIIKKSP